MENSYSIAFPYETLIRRAHKSNDRTRNGADVAVMRNLIDKERGTAGTANLPSAEKQLEKVRGYIGKALDKILKWKLTDEERAVVEEQRRRLDYVGGSADLLAIVNSALAATQRFI